ncbi:hypothetical protein CFN78_14975 [Amycolatopsis antarctica]|uniref:Uncharacterized protein n=1 Tax=Amycolatopsis antarctica TaxID=1854586 RepID=A0A263D1U4_9PSEU|nr:hypothetical protein [Amycolatopsis antarctica]OZM72311.1 hypothetical protein CFN78_14975 [Amycolatopsis antarctica]
MNTRFDTTAAATARPNWSAEGATVIKRGLRRLAQAGLMSTAERDRLLARITALPIRPAR